MSAPTLTVIGAGYVGLPTAVVFAQKDHRVFVLDVDETKINLINQGKTPFKEPGLGTILKKVINSSSLIATTDYSRSIPESKIIFICVGTPSDDRGRADLGYVFSAVEQLVRHLADQDTVIVIRSTVPPMTSRRVQKYIDKNRNSFSNLVSVVSSPEFLRQGNAMEDTYNPSRILIGTDHDHVAQVMLDLYQSWDCPKLVVSPESAELVKYASNAYLAARIVFADQISDLAENLGADVQEVLKGVGLDPRIGGHFWYPGLGYGGYCFPKDVKALANVYQELVNKNASIFHSLDHLNEQRLTAFVNLIKDHFGGLIGRKLAVWGLSSKPQSPDLRGSKPLRLVRHLIDSGGVIHAFDPDPEARVEAERLLRGVIQLHDQPFSLLDDASALLVLTEHPEFKHYDFAEILPKMRGNLLVDAKRILEPAKMQALGFHYIGTGYPR